MRCSRCGKDNPEDCAACPGCGLAFAGVPPAEQPASAPSFEYAGFMARAIALVCDLFVGFLIALAPIFGLIFLSAGRVQGDSWSVALFVLVFILYMTIAQFFFHTTVGKRLFGLQIRTAAKARPYPDLLELMVRESVGKYLCQWWLGLGFLAATYDSMHMTWADRLAGTVVVRALPVSRTMKIARVLLIAVILILAGFAVLGLMFVS